MRGILLAGGEGTRLRPATEIYNKHMALVYDRPMVLYPLETLRQLGCDEVVIVSSAQGTRDISGLIKSGAEYGVKATYRVQERATGVADAIMAAEGIDDELFPVVLGDCYFDPPLTMPDRPTIMWNNYEFAQQHGVYSKETNQIVEKPVVDMGRAAIIGAYFYDQRAFQVIPNLTADARGEIGITELNNWYLANGADVAEYNGFFGDMGTPNGLLRVSNHIQGLQHGE